MDFINKFMDSQTVKFSNFFSIHEVENLFKKIRTDARHYHEV